MTSELKNNEEDYNSSSDEDYDPTKDTDFDPKDEIDDQEECEDGIDEEVEHLKNEKQSDDHTSEKANSTEGSVDVDAIFAELTGLAPKPVVNDTSSKNIPKTEERVYPKSAASASNESTNQKVYPKKTETAGTSSESSIVPGKKRVGLLDAAKSLSKRSKISVLEKSDRDWKDFTTQNNLKEDLESHNRGKGGYLNKMDFLNRADNRQFEKERAFRATARKDTGQ
ncbi:Craniofacial development protein 1 [Caenorhabditis elegans]|uniref:Craniofacial development protein 1 n=1 Tax=Caenorhabditis elegans TaxID=6239 RepID=P90867_CAEEL|nr:Craniofacial development protein 1 [Caenorhabditis elegans]CAB03080.2 Craniofacial development protein 1 [Caenorhabditis elegans]|eukprot:NP_492355.1 Uncharacterized protein CELE_F39H11.1 [Caenorhabditis elegans]